MENGAGDITQDGKVKLYYHHDRLGSTDYLTDNVMGKVTSYIDYDAWGAPIKKAILKLGVRELDLVTEYTGHPYDPVLGMYFAEARMYDAGDRRFMAVDPVKGTAWMPISFTQYVYVFNNPLKWIDPTGKLSSPKLNEIKTLYIEGLITGAQLSSRILYQSEDLIKYKNTPIIYTSMATRFHELAQVNIAKYVWKRGLAIKEKIELEYLVKNYYTKVKCRSRLEIDIAYGTRFEQIIEVKPQHISAEKNLKKYQIYVNETNPIYVFTLSAAPSGHWEDITNIPLTPLLNGYKMGVTFEAGDGQANCYFYSDRNDEDVYFGWGPRPRDEDKAEYTVVIGFALIAHAQKIAEDSGSKHHYDSDTPSNPMMPDPGVMPYPVPPPLIPVP